VILSSIRQATTIQALRVRPQSHPARPPEEDSDEEAMGVADSECGPCEQGWRHEGAGPSATAISQIHAVLKKPIPGRPAIACLVRAALNTLDVTHPMTKRLHT